METGLLSIARPASLTFSCPINFCLLLEEASQCARPKPSLAFTRTRRRSFARALRHSTSAVSVPPVRDQAEARGRTSFNAGTHPRGLSPLRPRLWSPSSADVALSSKEEEGSDRSRELVTRGAGLLAESNKAGRLQAGRHGGACSRSRYQYLHRGQGVFFFFRPRRSC